MEKTKSLYGDTWILQSKLIDGSEKKDHSTIISFKEKPNLEFAKKYVDSGNYYWNCGIFVFKASVYLKELEQYVAEFGRLVF